MDSREERKAVRCIADILDSFDPQEQSRILRRTLRDSQLSLFDPLPSDSIFEVLFAVMRESISEANEDRKYFLMKLNMYNKIAQALADYLQELSDATKELQADE